MLCVRNALTSALDASTEKGAADDRANKNTFGVAEGLAVTRPADGRRAASR